VVVLGELSGRTYELDALLFSAGEGSLHSVVGDASVLIKSFRRQLTTRQIDKIHALASLVVKPENAALPLEIVNNLTTQTPVGFVQPYFAGAVPLTRVLDSHGRKDQKFLDDLAFRVRLCRLLADAFTRVHSAQLVVGDVSDGNFLVGRDWLNRVRIIYVIDCNSFQVSRRSNAGNEFFASGVATEEYTAPEVQPTDWATSAQTVYSDSFGFAVLAWKILFGGSHPFAVITPRSVDVPPLGERIEKRLFPFCPGSPLPANWKAPTLQPSLAVLPVELRELFFRAFSSADPRDRATAAEWCELLRSWELVLTPSLPLRVLGAWNGSIADRLPETLSTFKPYLGRAAVFTALTVFAVLTTQFDFKTAPGGQTPRSLHSDSPRLKSIRPRTVDRDLFPEPIWQPTHPEKE
jgi:DNA-binding helix-hairpin-helix protein with protein kinase domain